MAITASRLLISNNASKLFFQPCVLLLKGFDGAVTGIAGKRLMYQGTNGSDHT
jgi:hypothetical protein